MKLFFERIGIVGVGLIGASFALAAKKYGIAKEVWGYSNSGKSSKEAEKLKIIDRAVSSLEEIGKSCDFIFVAVPVLSIPLVLYELSKYIKKGTVLTDGGSTKHFVKECHKYFKNKNFVGSHPIAGTEKSGPQSAFASLFENSTCIVTPIKETCPSKLEIIEKIWEIFGMKVVLMSPEKHDRIMAEISHMPHVVAYSLVNSVKDKHFNGKSITNMAGGGFRDFTRIARSDSTMWADIFVANEKNVVAAINDFEKSLKKLKKIIKGKDREKIMSFLNETKKVFLFAKK